MKYFCGMMQIWLEDRGTQPYKQTWDYQEQLLQKNIRRKGEGKPADQRLILVEHPPVYTLGKSGKPEHLLISQAQQQERGVEFFHCNRGGDITFHGPGQIVGYPILDLETLKTDLGWYLRSLEEVIIATLAHYGIAGDRSKGETGVWIEPHAKGSERKICAMGIRCSRWITMHGFALNVNTDLSYFNDIVPCGIVNKQVSSIQRELGHPVDMEEAKSLLLRHFEQVFGVSCIANGTENLTATGAV